MKKLLILTFQLFILSTYQLFAQNVGIGTTFPLARLHVADSSVVFTAAGSPGIAGNPPVTGQGRRMMWYADKAAFRVGYVTDTYWDKDSIGYVSFASGYNTKAIGDYSTAMGYHSIASGEYSTALGGGTSATGQISTTMGTVTTASGFASTAMGYYTTASGNHSTTMGYYTRARGYASVVVGMFNNALIADPETSVSSTTPLFIVGNGDDDDNRSNAMVVRKDGNIGIGTGTPNNAGLVVNTKVGAVNALFGANTTGVAIESNSPGIGLNCYYNGSRTTIADGYTALMSFSTTTGTLSLYNSAASSNASNPATVVQRIAIINNGNVGIGINTPAQKLSVEGNICYTGSIAACSDIRYKKNIQPVCDALNSLLSIHGIYYNWDKEKFAEKAFTDERQIGFSAQEIEKLFPEIVQTDASGYKAVDYSRLTPVLVEAIKEEQKEIKEQNEKIAELEQAIKELRAGRSAHKR